MGEGSAIARTEGNPFFLEESVRTLVESGVLVGTRGAYRLAQPLATIQVPATVQAVLAARIDRLPPAEKRLLQTAAVIGTEVPLPLLQAIAEAPEAALYHGLAHLQAAEFLYETRLFPEVIYAFKHALTHEVAYSGLLHERRRALHARIVEALEGLYPERLAEQVDRLAQHAMRGEVWDKALAYCQQAGARAFARSAYREAVEAFEHALEALQHLPESRALHARAIDLHLELRNALLPLGELGRLLHHLREAEARATALDDPHRLGRVAFGLAQHYRQVADYDCAIAAGQRILASATALEDVGLAVMAHYVLGRNYECQGDYRRGAEFLRQNVIALTWEKVQEHFGMAGLPAVQSRGDLVLCLAALGEFAEGIARGEEGLRMAEAVEHPQSVIDACLGLGYLHLHQGNFDRAILVLERSLALCQSASVWLMYAHTAVVLGAAYALAGRVEEAVPLLEHALERDTAMGRRVFQARTVVWLSEAHVLAGRHEAARPLAERALQLTRTRKERGWEARALRLLGEIAAQPEPPDAMEAEAYYRQALALAEELGMRPLQAHCHRGLGTLYARIGQLEQARAVLSAAIKLYRAMAMACWLPQAEATLAEVEGQEWQNLMTSA
jgi:tetratricopeptide (TPR) repeat protein